MYVSHVTVNDEQPPLVNPTSEEEVPFPEANGNKELSVSEYLKCEGMPLNGEDEEETTQNNNGYV